jgi:hypothetical protein
MNESSSSPFTRCHPNYMKRLRASPVWIKNGIISSARITNAPPRNVPYLARSAPIGRSNQTMMPSGYTYRRRILIGCHREEIERRRRDSGSRLDRGPSLQLYLGKVTAPQVFEAHSNISQGQAEMIQLPNPTKTSRRLRQTRLQLPLLRTRIFIVHPKRPP